jgi:hypothetical protein
MLLGLEPDAYGSRLRIVRPRLPCRVDRLELRGLRVGDAAVDLLFERRVRGEDVVAVEILALDGKLDVRIESTLDTSAGAKSSICL